MARSRALLSTFGNRRRSSTAGLAHQVPQICLPIPKRCDLCQ